MLIGFAVGMLMIGLVTCNTRFVIKGNITASMLISYAISSIWAIGVHQVANKGWKVGQAYAIGAALGTCIGMTVTRKVKNEKS